MMPSLLVVLLLRCCVDEWIYPSSPEGYGQSDRVKLGLDHSKIVGVTTLDVMKTNRFTSNSATSRL